MLLDCQMNKCEICYSAHQRSREKTVRRMGAWVDDRVAEEAVALRTQDTRRTPSILGIICDGGGGDFRSIWSSSSLLSLRRQFSRQLYEWTIVSFELRTKLISCEF